MTATFTVTDKRDGSSSNPLGFPFEIKEDYWGSLAGKFSWMTNNEGEKVARIGRYGGFWTESHVQIHVAAGMDPLLCILSAVAVINDADEAAAAGSSNSNNRKLRGRAVEQFG